MLSPLFFDAYRSNSAILPILPALGSLWFLVVGLGICVVALLQPRSWWTVWAFARSQWRGILVLGAGTGAVFIVGWLWNGANSDNAAFGLAGLNRDRLDTDAEWTCFRGSLERTGVIGEGEILERPTVLWSALSGCSVHSSPVFAKGRLYVVGFQGDRSRLECLSIDGRPKWSVTPSGMRTSIASPILKDGLIYCGEGVHSTTRSRVFCLTNPKDDSTPQIVWSFETNGHVEGTPAISQNRLFAPSGDDGLYAFDLSSAPGAIANVLWHLTGDRYADIETSLAAVGNVVYVGLGEGGHALVMHDAATGRELRRAPMPYPVFSPPAVLNDRVYIGMGLGNLLTAADAAAGEVRCLDASTLELIWTFKTPASVLGAVVVRDGEIVFASADGGLWVLDDAGQLVQHWQADAPILSTPAVSSGSVYCVAQSGTLTCLARKGLTPRWMLRLGRPGMYLSSPLVVNGRIYVGTPEDGLVCIGNPRNDIEQPVVRSSQIEPPGPEENRGR